MKSKCNSKFQNEWTMEALSVPSARKTLFTAIALPNDESWMDS